MTSDPRQLAAKRAAARQAQLAALRPKAAEARAAAETLYQQRKAAERGAADVEAMRELVSIPGFFPTPPKVIARMLEEAGSLVGRTVLEPSAGKGDIAKAARDRNAQVVCCEINTRLRTMLERDGFEVLHSDFLALSLDCRFDFVLMNPPFENGQDREHVMKAYDHLRCDGRLVAIMSEGPFFRTYLADTAFRSWLNDVGGVAEPLPEEAFMCSERPTGVRTRLVIIDR